eukprot:c44827_g1_i1 orf=403-678(+)
MCLDHIVDFSIGLFNNASLVLWQTIAMPHNFACIWCLYIVFFCLYIFCQLNISQYYNKTMVFSFHMKVMDSSLLFHSLRYYGPTKYHTHHQ